jgi:hypothetical protein
VAIGEPLPDADRELDLLLDEREGGGAHSAYNALTRRLVSFMRAAAAWGLTSTVRASSSCCPSWACG